MKKSLIFELLDKPEHVSRSIFNQILEEATVLEISKAFQATFDSEKRYLLCTLLHRRIRAELYIESKEWEVAIPILISALHDSDKKVCLEAADALGHIGDHAAGPSLFRLYQQSIVDKDYELCFVLSTAVAACHYGQAIPALIDSLLSSSSLLRSQASRGLYLLRAESAVEPLRKAIEFETNPYSLKVMKSSLCMLENDLMFGVDKKEIIIERLITSFNDAETDNEYEQISEKFTCLWSKQLVVSLISLLCHREGKIRKIVARLFSEMTYAHTFLLLRQYSKLVQEPLLAILNDSDPEIRVSVANALMVWGGKEAISPLVNLIDDTNVEVRKAAVQALAYLYKFAEGRTLEPLLYTLLNDRDSAVRYYAASGLHYLKDERAVNIMISGLENPQSATRKESARLLSALKDERAVDALIHALNDIDIEVREWVVEALWELLLCNVRLTVENEAKMRQTLPLLLMDKSTEIQERARNILAWLTSH